MQRRTADMCGSRAKIASRIRSFQHVCLSLAVAVLFCLPCSHADPQASRHACVGNDEQTRICRFSNLIMTGGRLIYVSNDAAELPKMSISRPEYNGASAEIVVLSKQEAQQALNEAESVTDVRQAALVYRTHAENWGHLMLDVTARTHRLMCSHLGLCLYNEEELAQLSLVFVDSHPVQEGNFRRIWKCYSNNPPLYAMQSAFTKHAYILKDTIAGSSHLSLVSDQAWSAQAAKTYYERLWACVGLQTDAHVKDLTPIKVTFIQRPLHETRKARTFVNIYDILPKLQRSFPGMEFAAESLAGKTFEEVVELYHKSSIVFAVNGAAMGNALFMRKGSVYVDVGPKEYHTMLLQKSLSNLGNNTGIKLYMYTVTDPLLKPVRWELVARHPQFQKLDKQELLELIQDHKCPPSIEDICRTEWLYAKTDFVADPEAIGSYIQLAMDDINKFNPYA